MNNRAPRLLPLIAVAIGGVLALKAVSGLDGVPSFLKQAEAFAEEAQPKTKTPRAGRKLAKPAQAAAPAASEAAAATSTADATPPAGAPSPICAANPSDLAREAGLSPAELRVLQSLQSRRGELDDREKGLETQLAVLSAAESKVDGKLKALTDLRAEIQALLGQADQKQDAEVTRLVTVYSAMKPDQAAAIMTQLDDRVRIPVAGKMKERTLAAILAKMSPLTAKQITEKLASRFVAAEALGQKAAAAESPPTAAPVKTAASSGARKPRKLASRAAGAKAAGASAPPAAQGASPALAKS